MQERKYRAEMVDRSNNQGEKHADLNASSKAQFRADQTQRYVYP
jgi:hypothetical protein